MQAQEAQRVPKKLYSRRNIPRHIIIKLPKIKDKERILKAAGEKEIVTYKGVSIRLSVDFSKETLDTSHKTSCSGQNASQMFHQRGREKKENFLPYQKAQHPEPKSVST